MTDKPDLRITTGEVPFVDGLSADERRDLAVAEVLAAVRRAPDIASKVALGEELHLLTGGKGPSDTQLKLSMRLPETPEHEDDDVGEAPSE